jgi:hypothetical protein
MINRKTYLRNTISGYILAVTLSVVFIGASAYAIQPIQPLPTPDPNPGSFGLEATKLQEPPTQGATIATPGNGASFTESPITVRGICPDSLLVEIYNNGVLVGSTMCENGSYVVEISLFAGNNDLTALVFDDLGQAGPQSGITQITYTNTRFTAFGELITLTSSYGRRSAPAGTQLTYPLQLAGGTGPYAFSIDWGDGTPTELRSQALAGTFAINHPYKNAGIYNVNIRVTDTNGVSAFLQVVAVSSGKVDSSLPVEEEETPQVTTKVLWIPALVMFILLLPTYWLGRRSQIISLRNKMFDERDRYMEE